MYTPAFLEIFVGLVIVFLWATWLRRRPTPVAVVAALPWVAGVAVMLGQMTAAWAIAMQMGGLADPAPVRYARWGSFGVVLGCLLVELGLTAWVFLRARA